MSNLKSTRDLKTAKPSVSKGSKTRTLKLDVKLRDYVNSLVASFFCRMFEVRDGFLYLLVDHHKFQNFKEAGRMKLGRSKDEEGYYYITKLL